MTYCIGMNLDDGLVFLSDSRTNAGVDDLRSAGKMRTFGAEGERLLVTLSSGNLSLTQNVLNLLEQRARHEPDRPGLHNAPSMVDVAQLLGDCMREVRGRDEAYLRARDIDPTGSFIVGGQIRGEAPRLFLVYSEGNYIESTRETPYFQTGETRFGKPIIDRVVVPATPLHEASKCALVSMDSTMRSNLSVGPPLDLLVYRRDSLGSPIQHRLEDTDPYLLTLQRQWNDALRIALNALPPAPWMDDCSG
ncbi:peptidase [Lysobacter sp. SG-8]|uniref:Peptidase n=1 Tax=Marilutibacter penaei TaxID=2759900 RepID=A0A7W3U3F8_9GAMM|nr:peptidase [Lysobacter penaei]MBB1088241.1 peptidase [Lysobacter penaei]